MIKHLKSSKLIARSTLNVRAIKGDEIMKINHFILCFFAMFILVEYGTNAQTPDRSMVVGKPLSKQTDKRVALLIGNSKYPESPLTNTSRDADSITNVLSQLGFTVLKFKNLDLKQMKDALVEFRTLALNADITFVYFAGHGIQSQNLAYLMPVSVRLDNEENVASECLSQGSLFGYLPNFGNPVNIVVMDACRDDPWSRSWNRSLVSSGSPPVNPPLGTIVIYAADAGQKSKERHPTKANGLFTGEFVPMLRSNGKSITEITIDTRNAVYRISGGLQSPADYGNLTRMVYLNGKSDGTWPESTSILRPLPKRPNYLETAFCLNMDMVYVEGGSFLMGCTDDPVTGCDSDEAYPPVNTYVKDFYISTTEVTQRQWQKVMGTKPSNMPACNDCPVEAVSWNAAQKFASSLSNRTGQNYRLPTEAEWEYAARGGNRSLHSIYSGSSNLDNVGWYESNSGGRTHPVKQKRPNELGLYGMSGNVWEWCSDLFDANRVNRVLRGGAWTNSTFYCHVSIRGDFRPDGYNNSIGYRLVKD